MSPGKKIEQSHTKSQQVCDPVLCPYCHSDHCWKHGTYTRKGFHSHSSPEEWILQKVPRHLCRDPSCERTFSILPENVLPYCRFRLEDLFSIADFLNQGQTPYHIAKYHWPLSLSIISRAKSLIYRAGEWLRGLCREAGDVITGGFVSVTTRFLKHTRWDHFSRMWFHYIYPLRVSQIINQHNVDLKVT